MKPGPILFNLQTKKSQSIYCSLLSDYVTIIQAGGGVFSKIMIMNLELCFLIILRLRQLQIVNKSCLGKNVIFSRYKKCIWLVIKLLHLPVLPLLSYHQKYIKVIMQLIYYMYMYIPYTYFQYVYGIYQDCASHSSLLDSSGQDQS